VRYVALLLLGLAAGFLLGRLTAPEERGVRGQPRAEAGVAEIAAPAPGAPAPRVVPDAPKETVVQPSGPVEDACDDDEAAEGVVEVDFHGFDGDLQAFVGSRMMRGEYEEGGVYADGDEQVVRFDLSPGTYDVWWLDREGRRHGSRVAVEAGQRTYLRAIEVSGAPPIPQGLGILDVAVAATWGGGLSVDVGVTSVNDYTVLETDSMGHGTITLVPGRYTLDVGDHRDDVAVTEGQVTSYRIEHRGEGDLILDAPEAGGVIGLARPGLPFESQAAWRGFVDGTLRRGLVYVTEGEYDVFFVHDDGDKLGVPLGRVAVHAGKTTWFRYELPRGGMALRVVLPVPSEGFVAAEGFVWVEVQRIIGGRPAEGGMTLFKEHSSREARFRAVLGPGRYSVTATAPDYESKSAEFDVLDRVVDLDLELVPAR